MVGPGRGRPAKGEGPVKDAEAPGGRKVAEIVSEEDLCCGDCVGQRSSCQRHQ
jgi:hypothetical protein